MRNRLPARRKHWNFISHHLLEFNPSLFLQAKWSDSKWRMAFSFLEPPDYWSHIVLLWTVENNLYTALKAHALFQWCWWKYCAASAVHQRKRGECHLPFCVVTHCWSDVQHLKYCNRWTIYNFVTGCSFVSRDFFKSFLNMGIICTTLVAFNQFNVAQMKIIANANISPTSFIEIVLCAVYSLFYW